MKPRPHEQMCKSGSRIRTDELLITNRADALFWVETGLTQATRDAETSHQIEPHEYQNYYRDRFLRDLRRSQPPVFIDAVGAGNYVYEDRNELAHETFPELRDYLASNYQLVRDVDGTRVYIRNDRL